VRYPRLRRWLAGALAAALLVITSSALAGSNEYDVVVVGGSPSGYAAAIAAHQIGIKRVLVLERREGGSSGRIQQLAIEKESIALLKQLGVDPEQDPAFTQMKDFIVRRPHLGDFHFPIDPNGIRNAQLASGVPETLRMFWRRNPVAIAPIDGVVHSLRSVAQATPGIDIVEGREVTDLHIGANGEVDLATEARDEHGKPLPEESPRAWYHGRYVYNGSGLGAMDDLLGLTRRQIGPTYRMVTAVFRDDNPAHFGHALYTIVQEPKDASRNYRVAMLPAQAGAGGTTTLTADIPLDVDPEDPKAVERFARSAAARSGYFEPGTRLELLHEPMTYAAARTRVDRVFVGPKGGERIMNGGDALATTTPVSALGVNVALQAGRLFAAFVRRAEEARTPKEAEEARTWAQERANADVTMLHGQDRLFHALTGAPAANKVTGALRVMRDGLDSVREAASLGPHGVKSLAERAVRLLGRAPRTAVSAPRLIPSRGAAQRPDGPLAQRTAPGAIHAGR
jgi:2-polyprenyl-6-methoxyphenol hydroxylase-like FAD-dependent oxidoreductase